jgi:hypothetical protein
MVGGRTRGGSRAGERYIPMMKMKKLMTYFILHQTMGEEREAPLRQHNTTLKMTMKMTMTMTIPLSWTCQKRSNSDSGRGISIRWLDCFADVYLFVFIDLKIIIDNTFLNVKLLFIFETKLK